MPSIESSKFGERLNLWAHREASLNWLALGLLLAAWNAADNDAGKKLKRREPLRESSYVFGARGGAGG